MSQQNSCLSTTCLAAGLVTAVFIVGCAPRAMPPADLATASVSPREQFAAQDPHVDATGAVADDWITSFQDPVLSRLVDEAIANNPDLRRAAAVWREARARVRVAHSQLLPTVDGSFTGERSRTVARDMAMTDTKLEVEAVVNWEIDLWGRLASAEDAAALSADASRLDYAYARQSLAAAVADAWFMAIQANRRLEIDRDLLQAEQRTAKVTQDKVDAGVGTQLEAELAEGNVALAQAAVTADRAAIEELTKALEALLGRYPAAELKVDPKLPEFPGSIAVGVPSELLERRPDIIAADRRVAAAFHRVQYVKAARLPTITLTGSLGAALDPSEAIWKIGGGLLAPLLTGDRIDAEVEISNAQQEQALAQYVSTAINAFREVETALANEQYLAQRETELERATNRMSMASRVGEDRYEAGILSIVDLTTIRRQYFQSRAELLAVRTERLRQRLTLYRALGGSYNKDNALATPQPGSISPDVPEQLP